MSEADLLMSLGGDSLMAVTCPLVVSLLGAYGFKRGFLTASNRKVVDKIIVEATMPCLIISKVLPAMNLERLMLIWPLLLMVPIMLLYGLSLGAALARCLGLVYPGASQHRGLIMVLLAFPNTFIIPLTMCLATPGLTDLLGLENIGVDALHQELALFFFLSYSVWRGAVSCREWRQKALNPPSIACFISIALGIGWGYLNSVLHIDLSKLAPLLHAVDFVGQPSVPLMLLNLGSGLVETVAEISERRAAAKTTKTRAGTGSSQATQDDNLDDDLEIASDRVEAESETSDSASTTASSKEHEEKKEEGREERRDLFVSKVAAAVEAAPAAAPLPRVVYVLIPFFRQVVGTLLSALIVIGLFQNAMGITNKPLLLVSMWQGAGPPMVNILVMVGISGNAKKELIGVEALDRYAAVLKTHPSTE
mmetsp:Transcript_52987/g.113159  ORF Transcript_52987/g.113159 Transcript_52987/m.113159 type:complete len:422 (-) Transcript_52987:309-1574(-)